MGIVKNKRRSQRLAYEEELRSQFTLEELSEHSSFEIYNTPTTTLFSKVRSNPDLYESYMNYTHDTLTIKRKKSTKRPLNSWLNYADPEFVSALSELLTHVQRWNELPCDIDINSSIKDRFNDNVPSLHQNILSFPPTTNKWHRFIIHSVASEDFGLTTLTLHNVLQVTFDDFEFI